MKKVDRTGEERLNNFGSKMVIVEYRKNSDVDIYISLSIIGQLKIKNTIILKREKSNVLMNQGTMIKVIQVKVNILCPKIKNSNENIKFGIIC